MKITRNELSIFENDCREMTLGYSRQTEVMKEVIGFYRMYRSFIDGLNQKNGLDDTAVSLSRRAMDNEKIFTRAIQDYKINPQIQKINVVRKLNDERF